MFFDARIAYIHADCPNYIRVSKNIPIFRNLFREVHYIGCLRDHPWRVSDGESDVHYHIHESFVRRGIKGVTDTIRYMQYVSEQVRLIAPDVVVSTNEDYVLPFAFGFIERPRFLVCDLIDSLAIRTTDISRYINPVWSFCSVIAKQCLDGMVEVTDERLMRHYVKPTHTTVVVNSPPWQEIVPRLGIPSPSIYVCGNVQDEISGVETLLSACEQLPDVRIVFAGRAIGRWMRESFLLHPRVINLGETTPRDSLTIAKSCSAIFAHYKPFITNHIFAAPNKLYDAMMLGVPLLINSECKISAFAEHEGFGLSCRFGDTEGVRELVKRVCLEDHDLNAACKRAQQLFRSKYAWQNMQQEWIKLFSAIGVPTFSHRPVSD